MGRKIFCLAVPDPISSSVESVLPFSLTTEAVLLAAFSLSYSGLYVRQR